MKNIKAITDHLISKGPMLKEYFSIEINKLGCLCSLPVIIDSYIPPLGGLPLFLLKMASRVI